MIRRIALFCLFLPLTAQAWGERGHGAVGVLALEQVTPGTRAAVADLLGATDLDEVVGACNWPDTWRDMGDGADTIPWHFVNIDPDEKSYRATRDCPEDRCVTAQINRHAARLGDASLSVAERRLAFKYVCHFVGDLHQPLHVAYADDEGGNRVTVRFRGAPVNLHRYWDSELLKAEVRSLGELLALLRDRPHRKPARWSPGDTVAWTNESFALARSFAYPPTRDVDPAWAARSWQVTQQQLDVAAARLAALLDSVLAGETGTP